VLLFGLAKLPSLSLFFARSSYDGDADGDSLRDLFLALGVKRASNSSTVRDNEYEERAPRVDLFFSPSFILKAIHSSNERMRAESVRLKSPGELLRGVAVLLLLWTLFFGLSSKDDIDPPELR